MLPDLQLPKFMPFTPQNALQQAMAGYRYRFPVGTDGQVLLIRALTADWVPAAADILTESFATALGAAPYTNFLRRQVKAYLEQHRQLPPKAVVLVALLLPAELAAEEAAAAAAVDAATGAAAAWGNRDSSGGGGDVGASTGSSQASSSSSSSREADISMAAPWQAAARQQAQQAPEQAQQGVPGSKLPHAELAADLGDGMAMSPMLGELGAPCSSSSSDSGGSEGEEQQRRQPDAPGRGAVLAGVVELSFAASTRSQYMTLNPPEDRPYMCNMAISPDLRGRGYGFALLQAAEALVAQLGETELYLHLRVQDEPAAGLYKKSGYEEVAADTFLVRFLGLDQRRLMRKRLPRGQAAVLAAAAGEFASPPPAAQPLPQKLRMDL